MFPYQICISVVEDSDKASNEQEQFYPCVLKSRTWKIVFYDDEGDLNEVEKVEQGDVSGCIPALNVGCEKFVYESS